MVNFMQKTTSLVGSLLLISCLGVPALAQSGSTPSPASPNQGPAVPAGEGQQGPRSVASPLEREFIVMAIQSNNAEIQTSELALQRSQNQDVREYAQRMIEEHTRSNEQLYQLAQQYNVNPPADAGPLNNAIALRLRELNSTEFDRAYMNAQVAAHLRAVGLYQTQIDLGRDQTLQSFASQQLPVIEQHYQTAREMAPNQSAIEIRPQDEEETVR